MNIFVTKLDYSVEGDELKSVFEEFGEVSSSKVIMDRETGRSKGFGFVEMPDDEAGQAAIDALDGSEIKGRAVIVKKARPKEEGGSRGGGGYNRGGGFNRY